MFQEFIKALFSIFTSVAVLCFGWFIGQKLTYRWSVKQKRREIQLSGTQQFYIAYGEFFAVWKLWNRLDRAELAFPERRWELHKRAAAAEAIIEGILVKLSSELRLTEAQICYVGCFRQGFQQLRQSIRKNQSLPWNDSEHREYKCFKQLTVRTAALLGSDWSDRPPDIGMGAEQLLKITSNKWESTWAADVPFAAK